MGATPTPEPPRQAYRHFHQQRHFAAHAEMIFFRNGGGERGRDTGVDGVPTGL